MQAASQQREGTAFVRIVVHAPAPDPDSDSAAVSAVRVGDVRGGSNVGAVRQAPWMASAAADASTRIWFERGVGRWATDPAPALRCLLRFRLVGHESRRRA